ncbi:hypothetical protein B7P43_G06849 [Cryptotermes secundus]|uniref:MADF domain-containing protein n=2 Tax=Cryptotermes secundus TaxID=105785 RepID=A0A2J7QLF9_9NEOP|nr:hypothetical protein B7P43_G06849 [Cryptotermes secundus]
MKFINLYKQEECLWNISLLDYKNKEARNLALERIAAAMGLEGFGVSDVKYKIKNIRSSYCQELKKIQFSEASCSSPEDVYRPTVVWFSSLHSFLKSFVFQRERPPGFTPDRVSRSTSIKDEEIVLEEVTQLYDTNEAWTSVEESACGKREASEFRLEGSASPEPARQQPKRCKTSDCGLLCKTVDRLKEVLDRKEEDEFETFGKSVACQLKRLSVRRAASAQLKIQAILTEERIEQELEHQAINVP